MKHNDGIEVFLTPATTDEDDDQFFESALQEADKAGLIEPDERTRRRIIFARRQGTKLVIKTTPSFDMFNAAKLGCSLACATHKEGKLNCRNVEYRRTYWNGKFQGGCWEFHLPGALEDKPATTKSPVPWHTRKIFVVEFFRACVVGEGVTKTRPIDGANGCPYRFEFHLRFSEDLRLVSNTPSPVILRADQDAVESQEPSAGSIKISSEEPSEPKSMPPEFCDCPIPSKYQLPTDGSNLPDSRSSSHTGANQGIKVDENGAPKAPQCSKCNCLKVGKKKREAFLQHWTLYKQNQEKNGNEKLVEVKKEGQEEDVRVLADAGGTTEDEGQQSTQAAEIGPRAVRSMPSTREETERQTADMDDDHRLLAGRPGEAVDAGPEQGQQQQEEQKRVQAAGTGIEDDNSSLEGGSSHEPDDIQPLKRQRLTDDDEDVSRDSAVKRRKLELQLALIGVQLEETRLKRRQAELELQLELQLVDFQQVMEVGGQA